MENMCSEDKVLTVGEPSNVKLQHPPTPAASGYEGYECSNLGHIELLDGSNKVVSVTAMTLYLMKVMPRSDMSYRGKLYQDCFTGQDGVKALKKLFKLRSGKDAIRMGRMLQRKQILHHVAGEKTFGFNEYYFRLQPFNRPKVLNSFCVWTSNLRLDPLSLIFKLEKLLSGIISSVTNGEGLVDYLAAESDEMFLVFEEAVCELQLVYLGDMNDSTRLAFATMLYNLMVVHAFVKLGVASNSVDRAAFFRNVCYDIGGDVMSLEDLKHGVIRANAPPPYLWKIPFAAGDPRRLLTMKKLDPRVHFVLSCGTHGCPPLKLFSPKSIESYLQCAAESYCENDEHVSVNVEENQLSLSMLFHWYQSDFAKTETRLPFAISRYLRDEKKRMLLQMISRGGISVKFLPYDWTVDALSIKTFDKSRLEPNQWAMRALFAESRTSKTRRISC